MDGTKPIIKPIYDDKSLDPVKNPIIWSSRGFKHRYNMHLSPTEKNRHKMGHSQTDVRYPFAIVVGLTALVARLVEENLGVKFKDVS